ncbi:MAG: hypothetical protein COA41_00265 [Sphingopyxis sp.]|nr:MAG: hypothetical protein COA41_00265 [Sphingopyxis sp.]
MRVMHMLETDSISAALSAAASFSIKNFRRVPVGYYSLVKIFVNLLQRPKPLHSAFSRTGSIHD